MKIATRGRLISVAWLTVLLGCLALQLWFPRIDAEPLDDTWSVDVGGRNALFQFAELRFGNTARNLTPLVRAVDRLDDEATLCILGPARLPTEREWESLLDWVDAGGRLLFAARWEDPELEIPGLSAKVGNTTLPVEQAVSAERLSSNRIKWRSKGFVKAEHAEPVVRVGESVQGVRISYGDGTIVLLASDQVFSNASLFDRELDNGLLVERLLSAAGEPQGLVFDESLNSTGTPKAVGILLSPEFRPITLQFLVLVIVFGWRGARRFGPVLSPMVGSRHNLTDHTDALGNLYWKTRSAGAALRGYLEYVGFRLRLRPAKDRQKHELKALAQRLGLPADDLERLLTDAERAAEATRVPVHRHRAATLIRGLSRLLKSRGSGR